MCRGHWEKGSVVGFLQYTNHRFAAEVNDCTKFAAALLTEVGRVLQTVRIKAAGPLVEDPVTKTWFPLNKTYAADTKGTCLH